MIDFETIQASAEGFARKCMKEDGELTPMFIAYDGNGAVYPMAIDRRFMNSETDKERLCGGLREFFRQRGIEVYAFICEAWVATVRKGDSLDDPGFLTPSQRRDRKEVVIVSVSTRIRSTMKYLAIIRGPDGSVESLLEEPMPEGATFSGRFQELLDPVKPS